MKFLEKLAKCFCIAAFCNFKPKFKAVHFVAVGQCDCTMIIKYQLNTLLYGINDFTHFLQYTNLLLCLNSGTVQWLITMHLRQLWRNSLICDYSFQCHLLTTFITKFEPSVLDFYNFETKHITGFILIDFRCQVI